MFHIHELHTLTKYFRNKELDELYACVFLKSLALSLISIFVPVYLYQLGFSLVQIALFFLVHYIFGICFFALGSYTISWIGIKHSMALGTLLNALYFYLLAHIPQVDYLVVAALSGVALGLYWPGLHVDFSRSLDTNTKGRELSFFRVCSTLAVMAGPFVGALFIAGLNFNTTLYIVLFLLISSAFPLFFTKDVYYPKTFSIRTSLRKGSFRSKLAHQAEAISSLSGGVFWPLFVFLNVVSFLSLGIIFSLASLLTIILLFFLGKWSDSNEKLLLFIGAFTHAPIWITRLFFLSPLGLFVNNFLSSVTAQILTVPFEKLIYDRAGHTDPANYHFFREFHLTIGRVVVLGIAMVFANFTAIFILAAATTFLYLLPMHKR